MGDRYDLRDGDWSSCLVLGSLLMRFIDMVDGKCHCSAQTTRRNACESLQLLAPYFTRTLGHTVRSRSHPHDG